MERKENYSFAAQGITYSEKYSDADYEFRHVQLTYEAWTKLPQAYRDFYNKMNRKQGSTTGTEHKYLEEMQLLSE